MRVLLPWRAATQLHASGDGGDPDGPDDDDERAPPPGDDDDDEADGWAAANTAAPSAKRTRLESEPPATAMTAGPPPLSPDPADDDDDDGTEDDDAKLGTALAGGSSPWPPLENEPEDAFALPTPIHLGPAHERLPKAPGEARAAAPAGPRAGGDPAGAATGAFERALRARGLKVAEVAGDGNCLFRAVALQVYGDAEMHAEVRARVCDFMHQNAEHFGAFLEEPLPDYLDRKRRDGVHGNNPEIQAVSELYNRPVEVFTPEAGADRPLNIFQGAYATSDEAIRLSYHDGNHFNAVVDPLRPTAGLGLGMPDLKIGLADDLQVSRAKAESDLLADQMELKRVMEESAEDEVKRVMKESGAYGLDDDEDALQRALKESTYAMDYYYEKKALGLSDVDATNLEIEQAILQSSIESYCRQEQGRKQRASPAAARRRRASPVHSPPTMNRLERDLGGPVLPTPPAATAATASATSAALSPPSSPTAPPDTADEYPETVQELVMNGFELQKVLHARELIGDNFDDLLAFLMSTSST